MRLFRRFSCCGRAGFCGTKTTTESNKGNSIGFLRVNFSRMVEGSNTKTTTCTTPANDEGIMITRQPSRDLSHRFEEILDQALGPGSNYKEAIFQEGERHYAAEMFRFYSAILNWEQDCTANKADRTLMRMSANKLVARFVDVGSPHENGCLSSETRQELLKRNVHPDFFKDAKYEVAKDIMMNQTLRGIIEQYASSTSPTSPQEGPDATPSALTLT